MRWEGVLLVTYFGDGTVGASRTVGCVFQVLWGAKCPSEIRESAIHSKQCILSVTSSKVLTLFSVGQSPNCLKADCFLIGKLNVENCQEADGL